MQRASRWFSARVRNIRTMLMVLWEPHAVSGGGEGILFMCMPWHWTIKPATYIQMTIIILWEHWVLISINNITIKCVALCLWTETCTCSATAINPHCHNQDERKWVNRERDSECETLRLQYICCRKLLFSKRACCLTESEYDNKLCFRTGTLCHYCSRFDYCWMIVCCH